MSLKKNYLAIVSGGLVLVAGTMIYLKITYNSSTQQEHSVEKLAETPSSPISSENTNIHNTNASPSIVQEVLSSSVVSSSNENNPNTASPTPNPPLVNLQLDENKQLQSEKKSLEERLTKETQEAKVNEAALKKEQEEKQALFNQTQKLQEEAKKRSEETEKLKEELKKALSQKQAINDKDTKICISYGPMNIDLKNRFKNILSNNKIANNTYQDRQLPQYEIYWNLGNNKLEALERFEKQKKEGALRDDKFKLTQDNNSNWIVPATTIAGDYSVAETLAKQLSASSSKFGGKWDIREKTGGHYIIFPNVNLISDKVLLIIDKDLRLNKTFC